VGRTIHRTAFNDTVRLWEKGFIAISDDHKSSPLDNATIEKMVRSVFKGDPEQLTESLLDYVCTLVNRRVDACCRNEVKPEIYRTIIEAIGDYRLMQKTGISVLDRAPDELVLPATRFLQYISPIGLRRRKQGGGDETPLAPPLET
jgi:hypothetical protein